MKARSLAKLLIPLAGLLTLYSASSIGKSTNIVFLGNSLTQHGPDSSIDWSGNWGMAASRADLDYVNRVITLLRKSTPGRLKVAVVSDFYLERELFQLSIDRVKSLLRGVPPASIVVLQFGDNVDFSNGRLDGKLFGDQYGVLLSGIRAHFGLGIRLVCIGKWWPSAAVDDQISAKCGDAGGSFVPIADIHAESWGPASSERRFVSEGVGGHPGDRAMSEIADRVAGSIAR